MRKEACTDTDRDDGDQGRDVRAVEETRLEQPVRVEEEGRSRDEDDAGRQPVESVDEVDGVRHHDDHEHRHDRCQVG